ncbi:MAG: hypothetical protein ACTSPV_16675 [Candidatus Hodarchaeales archaeon]
MTDDEYLETFPHESREEIKEILRVLPYFEGKKLVCMVVEFRATPSGDEANSRSLNTNNSCYKLKRW